MKIMNQNEMFFADTLEQERALVAELIASPAEIPGVLKIARPEMFYNSRARKIYGQLADLFAAGKSEMITLPLIYGDLDAADKEWFLDRVMTFQPGNNAMQIEEYARQIRNAFENRRLFALAEELRASALAGAEIHEVDEKIRAYQDDEIRQAGVSALSVRDAFNGLCDDLQTRRGHTPTGYPSLDRATYGGFADGNMIILAARPSVGKTSVALDIARSMSYAGAKVAFFSLEMTAAEITQKLLLGTDRLTGDDFKGQAEELPWDRIEEAGAEIAGIDMVIDDRSYSLEDICTQIVLLHAQGKCTAAFVDYLGLVEVSKDTRTPLAIKLAVATRRFKMLAKELQIPIVALAQLNRESAKENRSPELFDLRDSGAIEQDANLVLMLERALNDLECRDVYMWVRKNRSGQAGNFRIDLEANETFSRFADVTGRTDTAPNLPPPPAPMGAPGSKTYSPQYDPDRFHESGSAMEHVHTEFDY